MNFLKKVLESQLEFEKEKTEADAKKLQNLVLEYAREKEIVVEQQRKKVTSSGFSPLKVGPRQNDSFFSNDEASNLFNNKQTSVYDLLRNSSAINTLESLQSKLKEKDGEIMQLQVNIFKIL